MTVRERSKRASSGERYLDGLSKNSGKWLFCEWQVPNANWTCMKRTYNCPPRTLSSSRLPDDMNPSRVYSERDQGYQWEVLHASHLSGVDRTQRCAGGPWPQLRQFQSFFVTSEVVPARLDVPRQVYCDELSAKSKHVYCYHNQISTPDQHSSNHR